VTTAAPVTGAGEPLVLTDRVALEEAAGTAWLRLGNGSRRNALRREDWTAVREAFEVLASRPAVRAVVVRGRGGHFCAGSDLSSWATADQPSVHATFAEMERAFQAVESCPVPVVAVVEGAAAGAGCQLALACDLRVVHEDASLGMPTARLGIRPSPAFAARMIAAVGPGRARELLWTGRMVGAAEAVACGLAETRAPAGELDRTVADLVAAVTAGPPEVVAETKRVVAGLLPVTGDAVRAAGAPTVVHPVMQAALTRYVR
jgi:enoyl-CoA hydratase/carnithine racemase